MMGSLNYWQRYNKHEGMPDIRMKIIHSTRRSTLSGFGMDWIVKMHNHILEGKGRRGRRLYYGGISSKHRSYVPDSFTRERVTDLGPSETMSGSMIPYKERLQKQKKRSLKSLYSNFKNLDSRKKLHFTSSIPS